MAEKKTENDKSLGAGLRKTIDIVQKHYHMISDKNQKVVWDALQSAIEILNKLGINIQDGKQPLKPEHPHPTDKHDKFEDWEDPNEKYKPTPPDNDHKIIRPIIPNPAVTTAQVSQIPLQKYYVAQPIDLSKKFLPIKNQGRTGACAAFAAGAIMEYWLHKDDSAWDDDKDDDLSELFLWYIFRRNPQENQGTHLYDLLKIQRGEKVRSCYEYNWTWDEDGESGMPTKFAESPSEEAKADARTKHVVEVHQLTIDPGSWIQQLAAGKPILVGIDVDNEFMDIKSPYLYQRKNPSLFGLGHAVVIVGYTDRFPDLTNPEKPIAAFKIRNSWGKGWGELGYCWIPQDVLTRIMLDYPLVFDNMTDIREEIQGTRQTNEEEIKFTKKEVGALQKEFKEQHEIVESEIKLEVIELRALDKIDETIGKIGVAQKEDISRLFGEIRNMIRIARREETQERGVLQKLINNVRRIEATYKKLNQLYIYLTTKDNNDGTRTVKAPNDTLLVFGVDLHHLLEGLWEGIDRGQKPELLVLAEKVKDLLSPDGAEAKFRTTVDIIEQKIMNTTDEKNYKKQISGYANELDVALTILRNEIKGTVQALEAFNTNRETMQRNVNQIVLQLEDIEKKL